MTDDNVTQLAEKIVQIDGLVFNTGSKNDSVAVMEILESLLREAMGENLQHEIKERLGLLYTVKINEAYARAAEVARELSENYNDEGCGKAIAAAIERLKEGK